VRDIVLPKTGFVDHAKTGVIRGNTAKAKEIYPRLYWKNNNSKCMPFDWKTFPLDIIVVEKTPPDRFDLRDSKKYVSVTNKYRLIETSCVVCEHDFSIICVFVTCKALPSLNELSSQARIAQEEARKDLKPRHSFAVGGNYTTDPEYKHKVRNALTERMAGTIWNDGLQTYTSATPGWQGKYFTQYFKRKPSSNIVKFALPFVGMYAVESVVVPAIAEERYRLHRKSQLPSALSGVPSYWMPATQVGISSDFSVKTHADSCIAGVTETIFWANQSLENLRFAVTTAKMQFDIGARPCVLFQRGSDEHGTVPTSGRGSCGLVLITKRNTIYHFRKTDEFTNRIVVD